MRPMIRFVACVLCASALVALAASCGGNGGTGQHGGGTWHEILTTQISGKAPVKVALGTYDLGTKVRVGWVLSGPDKPPVTLTFRVFNFAMGRNFGDTVVPASDPDFKLVDTEAMVVGPIFTGTYRLFFSQRFRPQDGPGYDIRLTVSTLQ
jgi:hypothetical protein